MEGPIAIESPRRRRAATIALILVVLAACLWPWLPHLIREPSLLGDDTKRVEDLQLAPLSALWLRPFNEHLAPLFETVSWVAWAAAGRRLAAAPMAFTVASYVPFVLLLLALGSLARRALGTWGAAGIVVALFALTPVHAEVVYWYSASSFAWALAATCLAQEAADRARVPGARRWSAVAGLMTFLAPCGSGIGLLAGPAAAIVGWPRHRGWREALPALASIAGLVAYLGMAFLARHHTFVGQSVENATGLARSIPWMVRAPLYLVASGPFGVREAHRWPTWAGAIALGLATVAAPAWIARGGPWRWIAASAVLIAGGYLLTYPFRVQSLPGPEVFFAGRYHLFPQAGLALLIGAAAAPILARLDAKVRGAGPAIAVVLAAVLMVENAGAIRVRAFWHHFPEQAGALRGLDRLAEVCRDRGITRSQALARLDPVLTRWTNPPYNILGMLPQTGDRPSVPDDAVRATVIAALDPEERRIVFGGVDMTGRLVATGEWGGGMAARLVDRLRVRDDGPGGGYRHDGWPSFLEYEFPEAGRPPSAIRLPGVSAAEHLQLWWTDEAGRWSPHRAVTLAPRSPDGRLGDVVLPLDAIPQWRPGEGGRVRVHFARPGRVALLPPESVRPLRR